jgi:hypothetical protein
MVATRMFPIAAALLALAGLGPDALAQGYETQALPDQIEVVNHTNEPIEEVRISPQVDEAWGGDRLAGRTIQPGESARLPVGDLKGDCYFDVRVGGASGAESDYFGLNLCSSPVVAAE